jgi:hypothetical protein
MTSVSSHNETLHKLEQVRSDDSGRIPATQVRGHRQTLTFQSTTGRTYDMKKPTLRIEQQQQPRNIERADIAPEKGYSMVVDGRFKTHFSEGSAAKAAATELLARHPMLQVEIYDAESKRRTRVEQGKDLAPSET